MTRIIYPSGWMRTDYQSGELPNESPQDKILLKAMQLKHKENPDHAIVGMISDNKVQYSEVFEYET